jgi:hypothetical protein
LLASVAGNQGSLVEIEPTPFLLRLLLLVIEILKGQYHANHYQQATRQTI